MQDWLGKNKISSDLLLFGIYNIIGCNIPDLPSLVYRRKNKHLLKNICGSLNRAKYITNYDTKLLNCKLFVKSCTFYFLCNSASRLNEDTSIIKKLLSFAKSMCLYQQNGTNSTKLHFTREGLKTIPGVISTSDIPVSQAACT